MHRPRSKSFNSKEKFMSRIIEKAKNNLIWLCRLNERILDIIVLIWSSGQYLIQFCWNKVSDFDPPDQKFEILWKKGPWFGSSFGPIFAKVDWFWLSNSDLSNGLEISLKGLDKMWKSVFFLHCKLKEMIWTDWSKFGPILLKIDWFLTF